ncbi:unnamed protein product [Prorocentrum cordatum]|uniref:Uncharacterized protein n=1 Tax=Prorocentrum cordatum TaxID=2364126 RepID=A0ABN9RD09_9DINO|nr:unnamed protein product [Polarella glacialis]
MAREGDSVDRPSRRCPDARRAAQAWARLSADRAVLKLSTELNEERDAHKQLRSAVAVMLGSPELADRLLAVVPHLQALLGGVLPSASDTRRRGVALHADARRTSIATATDFEVKRLQKGPRIERRRLGREAFDPEALVYSSGGLRLGIGSVVFQQLTS